MRHVLDFLIAQENGTLLVVDYRTADIGRCRGSRPGGARSGPGAAPRAGAPPRSPGTTTERLVVGSRRRCPRGQGYNPAGSSRHRRDEEGTADGDERHAAGGELPRTAGGGSLEKISSR